MQNDNTEVLFRFQDASDPMPLYMLSWYSDDQDPEQPWERYEELMVSCLSSGADGPYESAVMKTKAMDFFQRENFVRDINRFIEYIISTGDTVNFRMKSVSVYDNSDGISVSDDGMQVQSIIFIRYCVTYKQETLPKLYNLSNQDFANYDE